MDRVPEPARRRGYDLRGDLADASWYTSPATTRAPNAIAAMIDALAPASNPSTSAVGLRVGAEKGKQEMSGQRALIYLGASA